MRKMTKAQRRYLIVAVTYAELDQARAKYMAAGDRRLELIRRSDNSASGIAKLREACGVERDLYRRYRALRDA